MTPYETHQIGTLTVNIFSDPDPTSPREAFDNLGTMVCWHRRYTLGDAHDFTDPEDFFKHLTRKALTPTQIDRWNRIQSLIDRIPGYYTGSTWGPKAIYMDRYYHLEAELDRLKEEALSNYVILPLYLYDHGGITMSTSSFACSWDSGQVGWIYMTLGQAMENWHHLSDPENRDTLIKLAERCLRAEVEEYDAYLRGDAWGYTIEDERGDEIESCWGFLGEKDARQEAEAAARALAATLPIQLEMSL